MPSKQLKKIGICRHGESDFEWEPLKQLLGSPDYEFEEFRLPDDVSKKNIAENLAPYDIVLLESAMRIRAMDLIPTSMVASHFMHYADYLERRGELWWTEALFPKTFHKLILSILRRRNFRGPVIFLGDSFLAIPIIEVLARFGFKEFVFLEIDGTARISDPSFDKALKALVNVEISTVDSTTFIQSQTEYAICLIASREYSQVILEDMSYFHFLSLRSTVIDISNGSNFPYEEVNALGVTLVEKADLQKKQCETIIDRITHRAKV